MSTSTAFGNQVSGAGECKKLPLHWEPISLTDDDVKLNCKSTEALVYTERPVRKDLSTICMRIAMIFVFLALISTLLFVSLRFFVVLEQRAEEIAHRGDSTNYEEQSEGSDYYYSVSESETASFEQLFSTLMRALDEDPTTQRHPGCNKRGESTISGRHHVVNSEKSDVESARDEPTVTFESSETAKSTQENSITTESSEQDDESTSASESKDQVWGFVHKSGVRIVNGRVVSNWDQMIQFGPADESKSASQIGTESSQTAVALAQPSKNSDADTQVHPARAKHWGKNFIGGHHDSTDSPKSGRKHGRWPMRNMRKWMSERFGKLRNWFSTMMD